MSDALSPVALSHFFASGQFVDWVLLFMALEGAALIAYQQKTGRGIQPASVIANLIAGGALLLALRATLAGWGLPVIAACLALSFAAHVADLQRRWRS